MKYLVSCLGFLAATVHADSRVSVIELGKGGAVHHTTSTDSLTTPSGITSFWNALHGGKNRGRYLQQSGMTVVPDIFKQPDDGIIISLSGSRGINFDETMPTVSNLRNSDGKKHGVVGQMDVYGTKSVDDLVKEMAKKVVGNTVMEDVDASNFLHVTKKHATDNHDLSFVKVNINDNTAATTIDMQLGELLQTLERDAMKSGQTIVVHLITEEDESDEAKKEDHERRQLLVSDSHRRLEDEQQDGEDGDNNNNNNNNGNYGNYNGFYGVGYYNNYGEWVTPYKSMFQIQYFNVVLWSSIGLTMVLFYCIALMLDMPLMPDTLLFGESAKLVGDE